MTELPPALMTIPAATRYTGHSRSRLYVLAREGRLRMVQVGKGRTLIDGDSLRAYLASLTQKQFGGMQASSQGGSR